MIAGDHQHYDGHEDLGDGHEVFEALCALSMVGELSVPDQERLNGHLGQCESCREILEEFERLTLDVLPLVGAEMHTKRIEESLPVVFDRAAEGRLLAAIGGELETAAHAPSMPKRSSIRRWHIGVLAATLAVGIATGAELMREYASRTRIPVVMTQLRREEHAPSSAKTTRSLPVAQSAVWQLQVRIHDLEMQVAAGRERLDEQAKKSEILTKQLLDDEAQVERLSREKVGLTDQVAAMTAQADQLRQASQRDSADEAARAIQLAQVEHQIKVLRMALDQKEQALNANAELLAHDRDIRDLIGARNVYMAEVYDVAESGKTKKPFGRVFYTKDRSLIFYGYDLDQQPHLKQAVAFQGWGTADAGHQINLGLFYQDESKNRWILKFNDARMLAHVNSVFITVEPAGGSEKPTGKPLLTAYLRLEPNHP